MTMRHGIAMLAMVAMLLAGPQALAKKGGGGNPGGGGGGGEGGGIADTEVTILYLGAQIEGPLWKGDNAGNVEQVSSVLVNGSSFGFGPAGSTDLVFVSDTQGRGIYATSDFRGGGLTKVVSTTYLDWVDPDWSNSVTPLGEELIAYIDYDSVSTVRQLYVTTLSGDVTQLTYGWDNKAHPCWNPSSGNQLLVQGQGESALWLIDLGLDGDGDLVVQSATDVIAGTALDGLLVNRPSFAPDGSKVVFNAATAPGGWMDVWTYDLATGAMTNLTNGVMDYEPRHPCIRSDGRVMFSHPHKGKEVLWVMEANGSNIRPYGNAKPKHDQFWVTSRR